MRGELDVVSNQSVLELLEKLEKVGAIRRQEAQARGIQILPLGYKLLDKRPLAPFLGVTSAGSPIEAIEQAGMWQQVSHEVARFRDNVFLLKISGDSMINAGIADGDVVLVKDEKEFISGDIVLAHCEGNATVKRFMSEDKPPYVYLKPENPNYENILFTEETRLAGKVVAVLNNEQWRPVK